jgi:hypothetical protein
VARISAEKNARKELAVTVKAHDVLTKLSKAQQQRALAWILDRLSISAANLADTGWEGAVRAGKRGRSQGTTVDATGLRALFSKKKPQTEVERIVTLARFASTAGRMNSFRTRDLTRINAQANLSDFTNASVAMSSAQQRGLFAPAGAGTYRLTDLGTRFVEVLPNHDAAKTIARGNGRKPGRPPKSAGRRGRRGKR